VRKLRSRGAAPKSYAREAEDTRERQEPAERASQGFTHPLHQATASAVVDTIPDDTPPARRRSRSAWEGRRSAGRRPSTGRGWASKDRLYDLTRIDYRSDVCAYAAEVSDNTRPQPPPRGIPSTGKRVMKQGWSYDWLGNTTASTDDANLFYERSLGTIGNEGYRLTSAARATDGLSASYDAAGYLNVDFA